jgi:catechol 2,3-dioxygenase-like lactoylglutathione lyase family enzyme
MQVHGVNHVNIITRDLAATVEFYESVLGMKAQPIPVAPPGFDGRWICDHSGHPIFHVQVYNADRHGAIQTGLIGSIDHVALACAGFAATRAHCAELGVEHRVNSPTCGRCSSPIRTTFRWS